MRIKVSKNDLEATLQVAIIALSGSGSDLSAHFLLRIKGDRVEVLTYNGSRLCSLTYLVCEIEEGEDGDAMTVEGWRLVRWLGGVRDAALWLEHDQEHDPGVVKATSPRGSIHFKSLDPAKFPFFDKTLAAAKVTATVPAERLKAAVGYAKHFIADTETQKPEIAQTEAIDGALWATDKRAVTIVRVSDLVKGEGDTPTRKPLLTDAEFRLQSQDVPSVLKFLGLKGTTKVEILEDKRKMFLRRDDGALLGASRPLKAFPALKTPSDDDPDEATWVIKVSELQDGFHILGASAEKDDTKVRFRYDTERGQVMLAVQSASGREDSIPIDVLEEVDSESLPEDGFTLDYTYLNHIMSHFGGDTLTFGMTKRAKGGFVRLRHDIEGDSFVTVVVWRV